jgi:predicted nucleotidyltransferase component of viral defense system
VNEAIDRMMARYECRRLEDYLRALREILQEIALLGLWRSKFFERAAFYGGSSLRILHGLDRYSADLDFSLLAPDPGFDLERYGAALKSEMRGFGFEVSVTSKPRREAAIRSAFIKADTLRELLVIRTAEAAARKLAPGQVLKIKLEVDTDPPPGFDTESRFLLHPIAFSVRAYALPDLFAGKMHALLCRRWKNRVSGRDWYDLVWFVANHPRLHLDHLRRRMVQSGHLGSGEALTPAGLRGWLLEAIDRLDVARARSEVADQVVDPGALAGWSRDLFRDVAGRIETV